MKNVLIINTHQESDFSKGELTQSIIDRISLFMHKKQFELKYTTMKDRWDIEEEIEKHLWADIIILQIPVNWMGVSWSFKKYMDEVYTAGMTGKLCLFDGRNEEEPTKNYGSAGQLNKTKYMLSLTFNAPKEAFNDKSEYLFQGKSVDDLFFPQHMNFRFFGMQALSTFACYDVLKNPQIENDFIRLEKHLEEVL